LTRRTSATSTVALWQQPYPLSLSYLLSSWCCPICNLLVILRNLFAKQSSNTALIYKCPILYNWFYLLSIMDCIFSSWDCCVRYCWWYHF
jgi:hypothetical protein